MPAPLIRALPSLCLSAVEVLLNQGGIDHESVRLNDRLQRVTDAAFLLDVVLGLLDSHGE